MEFQYSPHLSLYKLQIMQLKVIKLAILLALMCLSMGIQAQHTISGEVRWQGLEEPVIGLTLLLKGTNQGAVTDIDGKFQFNQFMLYDTLQLRYIGIKEQELVLSPAFLEAFAQNPVLYVEESYEELIACPIMLVRYVRFKLSSGLRNTPYGAELELHHNLHWLPEYNLRFRYERGADENRVLGAAFLLNTGLPIRGEPLYLRYQFQDIRLASISWQRHLAGVTVEPINLNHGTLYAEAGLGQGRREEESLSRQLLYYGELRYNYQGWGLGYQLSSWAGFAAHQVSLSYQRGRWAGGMTYQDLQNYQEARLHLGYTFYH